MYIKKTKKQNRQLLEETVRVIVKFVIYTVIVLEQNVQCDFSYQYTTVCLQNFEIELDGSQTVRVLVHSGDGAMVGMCALEVMSLTMIIIIIIIIIITMF